MKLFLKKLVFLQRDNYSPVVISKILHFMPKDISFCFSEQIIAISVGSGYLFIPIIETVQNEH